ncbi:MULTISPECIES: SulP family inorganic anion transporter [Shewanella]|uniref:SulP family inorganic anion transporter n=1 Tax=Shewanella TaxID=22 RepID=UPI000C600B94|nr:MULTISPECIES: SulP family inorganic anion transporter [Shewanella]NCQ43511.1 SulP family inorganic anion transporter [Shewanella frigidimarina]NCO69885.1 SulP family inorganic anion transporter [Shewanella vesiculosa]NCP35425.1 SulP family inorganic anion transporter [Shewanella vesiculosa]NCP68006.1 SulP family inorganic anion transporter [Shewanella vesiculosa]NCP73034.1 SulP family inorganic anion transporter [Shewanella vesiculosa]
MFDLIRHKTSSSKADILSGLTVALALIPEAVAFAFVAHVEPMVGLYAAFIMGLITALIGGRPGMISGATGAMAVVMVSLVIEHGVQYLFAAVVLAGLIQILAGVFKLGKFIRIVPYPVMIGFVNGLAIVIFLAQLGQFKVKDAAGNMIWMAQEPLMIMLALVVLTMAIIHFLPKLTTAVPSSLVAILTVTAITVGFNLETSNVLDFLKTMSGNDAATIAGNLPSFAIPSVPFSFDTFYIILPYAFILAAVGLIESLLTLTVIDEMTNTRGQSNKECVGQGVGNITSGFFGAMGGCAMIGQSMININSGGRGRLSGITAALALLAFILFGSAFIEIIPLAALVGVMFIVVIGTFEWASFKFMNKVPKHDAFVIILVTTVTVFTDLAFAVFVGVIVSALVFAWEHAKHINVDITEDDNGWKIYRLNGPLFFGSVANFLELFDAENDNQDVIIDFKNSRVADHSALEAIDTLAERYVTAGKRLHLRHLSQDCKALLHKARDLVEVNLIEDPHYKVADDKLD